MLQNTQRLENLLFQQAGILVERGIDVFLFPPANVVVDEPTPTTRPPTPIPAKVPNPVLPRPIINLCTNSDSSIIIVPSSPSFPSLPSKPQSAITPPSKPRLSPPGTIKKPSFREATEQNRVHRCFTCKQPGNYRSTCPAPPCDRCGKIGHTESICPQLSHRGRRITPRNQQQYVGTSTRLNPPPRIGEISVNFSGPMGYRPNPDTTHEYFDIDD